MAVRLPILRRRPVAEPVDNYEVLVKAIKVASRGMNLADAPPEQRQLIDTVAKAVTVGARWTPPGVSSGSVNQMVLRRPVSATVAAQQAALSLGPSTSITPVDIELATRAQGMDWVQPFAPGQPLTPYYGYNRQPRERNYNPGRNVSTDTRPGRIPYVTIKQMVESYDVAMICIRHAIQDLRSMRVRFEMMDGYGKNDPKALARGRDFMRYPDGKLDLRSWICKHATDVWRYDCGTLYRQRDRAGNLIRLPIPDGTLFAPMLDYFGSQPEGQAPAYQQFVQGIPWDYLRAEDLIYKPMWPHTEDPYGVSPIETVLVNANTDIRLQQYFLQFFTTGTVPEAFAMAPEDQSDKDALAEWQETYNDWSYGDQAMRWGLRWLPFGTELEFYKPQQFDPDVAEYVMRRTVSAFMMVPQDLGLTQDVNRATADTQMDTQFRINSLPNVSYYEDMIDNILQQDLGLPIQMRFDTGREKEDRLVEAQAWQIYISTAMASPDEGREKVLGFPVDPDEKIGRLFDSVRLGPIPVGELVATSGDIDPITFAPKAGSVQQRQYQPLTDQASVEAQNAGGDTKPAPKAGGAGPKGPAEPAGAVGDKVYPKPRQRQQPVAPTSAPRPGAKVVPTPRPSAGAANPRAKQQTASQRALKEATAGIGIGTGIAGISRAVEEHEGEEDDERAESNDLWRWRRVARGDVAKGREPRLFYDHSIRPVVFHAVWEELKKATTRDEVDSAFQILRGEIAPMTLEKESEPEVAGIALVAEDTGRVLMVQRGNKHD